ncbi:MAG TPA: 50S ribosomal protein L6 [Actinomycetota bacterium]|nr:50S ribosomal protein L6 [Actinomycetota bacterium]
MSRIGKEPITIPDGVTVAVEGDRVTVTGPKGTLHQAISPDMQVTVEDGTATVRRPTDERQHRALHGLTRTLVANMIEGVTKGFEKALEIQGVGYRAALQGRDLELQLGFSHPVHVAAPDGIEFEVPAPTRIVVRGIDKQLVGAVAADIRKIRKPEPYKGKGVRYEGEYVRKKAGKAAKGVG